MSCASAWPRIPSFPAIPAKTKAEEAALAPCRMCWGVQSSPSAVPGSRRTVPGALPGSGAGTRAGGRGAAWRALFPASPG